MVLMQLQLLIILSTAPKKDFIPVDLNAAWKIGEEYARERNLILVHGTEITRKMPPGHFNALIHY